MSVFVTENFIKKRGVQGLIRFQDLLNQGAKLYDIAEEFHLSSARVNVLRDRLFVKKYIFKPSVSNHLQHQINIQQYTADELKARLKEKILDFH